MIKEYEAVCLRSGKNMEGIGGEKEGENKYHTHI